MAGGMAVELFGGLTAQNMLEDSKTAIKLDLEVSIGKNKSFNIKDIGSRGPFMVEALSIFPTVKFTKATSNSINSTVKVSYESEMKLFMVCGLIMN